MEDARMIEIDGVMGAWNPVLAEDEQEPEDPPKETVCDLTLEFDSGNFTVRRPGNNIERAHLFTLYNPDQQAAVAKYILDYGKEKPDGWVSVDAVEGKLQKIKYKHVNPSSFRYEESWREIHGWIMGGCPADAEGDKS